MAVEVIYRVKTKRGEVKDFMDKREADYEDARLEVMYGLSALLKESSEETLDKAWTEDDCDQVAERLMAEPDKLSELLKSIPKKRKAPGRKRKDDTTETCSEHDQEQRETGDLLDSCESEQDAA